MTKISTTEDRQSKEDAPADFETAISATGFGKFNILLLLAVIPYSCTQTFESNSMGYVLPIAQCDLELTLENKGQLIAANYAGMIISGFIWSYFSDIYGRRKVVIFGCSVNFFCYFLAAFSSSVPMLLCAKFVSGFMYTGPMAAVASYLSEFHSTTRRAKIQIFRGISGALAITILPLIGWAILPTSQKFYITESFGFQAWNIFLMICSIPSITTALIFTFVPESPRFLMSRGRNSEALQIFQMVHRINTGKSDSYPIKCLVDEKQADQTTKSGNDRSLLREFLAVKPLFLPPHCIRFLHSGINFICLSTGAFVLKLWYPQILQGINDYNDQYGSEAASICKVIDTLGNKNETEYAECSVNLDNSSVYINASIFGSAELLAFLFGIIAINRLGKKTLVVTAASLASVCPILMYFLPNATIMMVLFPLTMALGELCANVLLTISLELFPTALRMTALNLQLTAVRAAIAGGNVIFPYLMIAGCIPLLSFITVLIFVPIILTSLLPSTENKALE